MKILILGGGGMLGPHLIETLEDHYTLRVTDIVPIDTPHETMQVDVANLDQVKTAAEGMDVIVNCSVLRTDRKVAFDVNSLGTYNAMRAAVDQKMTRFINTGPHYSVAGPRYYAYDFNISTEVPAHPGVGNLYAMSKSAGIAICDAFALNHPIHVVSVLMYHFDGPRASVTIKHTLEVDLARLPSRHEKFWVDHDPPYGRLDTSKAEFLLGMTWPLSR